MPFHIVREKGVEIQEPAQFLQEERASTVDDRRIDPPLVLERREPNWDLCEIDALPTQGPVLAIRQGLARSIRVLVVEVREVLGQGLVEPRLVDLIASDDVVDPLVRHLVCDGNLHRDHGWQAPPDDGIRIVQARRHRDDSRVLHRAAGEKERRDEIEFGVRIIAEPRLERIQRPHRRFNPDLGLILTSGKDVVRDRHVVVGPTDHPEILAPRHEEVSNRSGGKHSCLLHPVVGRSNLNAPGNENKLAGRRYADQIETGVVVGPLAMRRHRFDVPADLIVDRNHRAELVEAEDPIDVPERAPSHVSRRNSHIEREPDDHLLFASQRLGHRNPKNRRVDLVGWGHRLAVQGHEGDAHRAPGCVWIEPEVDLLKGDRLAIRVEYLGFPGEMEVVRRHLERDVIHGGTGEVLEKSLLRRD